MISKEAKECNELHDQAMKLADQAFDATRKNKPTAAKEFYSKAFEFESKAAMVLVDKPDVEPSRSVLFRSAAWLAINSGRFRDAEKMASLGLSGNPPSPIDRELREVLGHIFEHYKNLVETN